MNCFFSLLVILVATSSCFSEGNVRFFRNGQELSSDSINLMVICKNKDGKVTFNKLDNFQEKFGPLNGCDSIYLLIEHREKYVLFEDFWSVENTDSLYINWYDYESAVREYPFLLKAPKFECAVTYSFTKEGMILPNKPLRLVKSTNDLSQTICSRFSIKCFN